VLEDVFEQITALAEPQLVDEQRHLIAVPRVADSLVVQLADAAFKRFAQRAEAAAGVEGLVADPVERELLVAFQRKHLDAAAFVDGVAGVAVLVDESVRTPGEVVLEGPGGELRQGADPHVDAIGLIDSRGEMIGDDRDEARRQTALRHEDLPGPGLLGDGADAAGGFDVFGEIEVAGARRECGFGDARVVVETERGNDRVAAGERRGQLAGVLGINVHRLDANPRGNAVQRSGARVANDDVIISAIDQQSRDHAADFASA
jgi:hypothetical protein